MSEDSREMGVDFEGFEEEIADHDYPTTADDLVAEYGEAVLTLPNGETTVGEILGGLDEEFEGPEAVRQAVFNMIGSEAVGRRGYSDRDPPVPGEEEGDIESSL